MNLQNLSNESLLNIIARMGKDMTASSSTRAIALEKERFVYVKEAFRRGLKGYWPKKKYRLDR